MLFWHENNAKKSIVAILKIQPLDNDFAVSDMLFSAPLERAIAMYVARIGGAVLIKVTHALKCITSIDEFLCKFCKFLWNVCELISNISEFLHKVCRFVCNIS